MYKIKEIHEKDAWSVGWTKHMKYFRFTNASVEKMKPSRIKGYLMGDATPFKKDYFESFLFHAVKFKKVKR